MFDKIAFGQRLCACRETQSLSKKELAVKLNISENYLAHLEAGRKTPSMKLYIDIINVLGIKADSLIRDCIETCSEAATIELQQKISCLSGRELNIVNAVLDTLIENLNK